MGLPGNLRPAAYALAILADSAFGSGASARIVLADQPIDSAGIDNIVLVVDESVVSDVFDQQSSVRIEPDLGALQPLRYDFSPAASGSNCSADSNRILMVGPRQDHLKADLNVYPSIWEYAKRAGYRTVYIDEQNGMDVGAEHVMEGERDLIDQVIVAGTEPVADRDGQAGAKIDELLRNGDRHFIYVNKVGAHFPRDSKYPGRVNTYRPTLGVPGNPLLAHKAGQPHGLFESISESPGGEAFKNSYRNAVEWNLNSFFAALQDISRADRSVVIYTSDHGQNVFRENGHTNTHCSSAEGAARSEGRVPVTIFTAAQRWTAVLRAASSRNAGRVSHFNLYSSVIQFMGFPEARMQDPRDTSLWDASPSPAGLKTSTGIRARFGQPVPWLPLCKAGEYMALDGRCGRPALSSAKTNN